jgi:hypothetical protein
MFENISHGALLSGAISHRREPDYKYSLRPVNPQINADHQPQAYSLSLYLQQIANG